MGISCQHIILRREHHFSLKLSCFFYSDSEIYLLAKFQVEISTFTLSLNFLFINQQPSRLTTSPEERSTRVYIFEVSYTLSSSIMGKILVQKALDIGKCFFACDLITAYWHRGHTSLFWSQSVVVRTATRKASRCCASLNALFFHSISRKKIDF
jgi:hypothetical protein